MDQGAQPLQLAARAGGAHERAPHEHTHSGGVGASASGRSPNRLRLRLPLVRGR